MNYLKIIVAVLLISKTMILNASAILDHHLLPVSAPLLPFHEATYLKPVEPNKEIHFTVWLKLRNQDGLAETLQAIYSPESPKYQQFLSATDYINDYAPLLKTKQALKDFFAEKGMHAEISNQQIKVTGNAYQLEKAFHVRLNYYRYHDKDVYACDKPPVLDEKLAVFVYAITGLSDAVLFHSHSQTLPASIKNTMDSTSHELKLAWETFVPTVKPTTTSIGGFEGRRLARAYNLQTLPVIDGQLIDGSGQTIVIIDRCGINTPAQILSDANTYNVSNKLPVFSPANFTIINEAGGTFTTCGVLSPTGFERAIAVDIVAAHTIAPKAKIVLVLAKNDLNQALSEVITTLISNNNTIAGFNNALVISNGWGVPEALGGSIEPTLALAAAAGISVNASSGNCGDGTYDSPSCTLVSNQNTVQYPASSAYVTAVGGTSMFVSKRWRYAFETVWGTYFNLIFQSGSGGGISQFYGPVVWQDVIKYFIAGGYGPVISFNQRAIPDISMLGDPLTGLKIYQNGAWHTVGGTNLASALFSGTLALVNQSRQLINKGPIGLAAPYFYIKNSPLLHSRSLRLITPPHQIISGATYPPAGAPLSAFTVEGKTFGWDSSLTIAPEDQLWNDAVGVGSPNVVNFVKQMTTF